MNRKEHDKDFTQIPWVPAVKLVQKSSELLHCQQLTKQKFLKDHSWKKSTSKKHLNRYIKLSDNTGNIFISTIYQLHKRNSMNEKTLLKENPFAFEQKLVYPPWEYYKNHKDSIQQRTKKDYMHFSTNNVINLKDLVDDALLWKKGQKQFNTILKRDGKIKKLKKTKLQRGLPEKKVMYIYYSYKQNQKKIFHLKYYCK